MESYITYILVIVLIIVIIFYQRFLTKKRNAALRKFAQDRGWVSSERLSDDQVPMITEFGLFRKGYGGSFSTNVFGKAGNFDILLFDYHYTAGSGKHKRQYHQTVFFLDIENILPSFELRKEGWIDKVGSWIGYDDIDFPTDDVFSKQYFLRGKDVHQIRALFTPEVRRLLLQSKSWNIETQEKSILFYRSSVTIRPQDLSSAIEDVLMMCRALGATKA